MNSLEILKTSVQDHTPFRVEELVFMPEDARKALVLLSVLKGPSRKWFEAQPLIRMIFLGNADGVEISKSGKQIRLEKKALRETEQLKS